MADKPEYVIHIKALPEEAGFRRAVQAQEELARATAKNIELTKQQQSGTSGAGGSATPLADAFIAKLKASNEAAQGLGDAQAQAAGFAAQTEGLVTNLLPRLSVVIGGVAVAAGALKAAFATMMEDNPQLQKSWENLSGTLSTVWHDAVRSAAGDGDFLKSAMDSLSVALGGATAAEQKLMEAMSTRLTMGEKALDQAGKMEKALKAQAEAAAKLADANNRVRTEQEETAKTQNAALKNSLADERRAIESDPNLTPEDRAAALAANDRAAGELGRAEKREGIAARRNRANDSVEEAAKAREAADALKQQQEERAKQILEYQTAKEKAAQDKAKAERAARDAQPRAISAGVGGVSMVPASPEAQKAAEEAKARAEQSGARQEQLRGALPTDWKDTEEGKKAEDAALEKARKAADEARKKEEATQRKAGIEEEKLKGEEDRNEADERRAEQDAEAQRQKAEQAKAEAKTDAQASQQAQAEVDRTLKALRDAGKTGDKDAIAKAQADYNKAKTAQKAINAPHREPDQTPMDDDIAYFDDDGAPVFYSDMAPDERAAAKAEATTQGRSRRQRGTAQAQGNQGAQGNGATINTSQSTGSNRKSYQPSIGNAAPGRATDVFTRDSRSGEPPSEDGPSYKMEMKLGLGPQRNAISDAMDAFSKVMEDVGAMAGHFHRAHQSKAAAIGEALAAVRGLTLSQVMVKKELQGVRISVNRTISGEGAAAS